jgi:3-hydroxyacyl-CoA dehydrogenase/enoyl-CoA hydratase/3-hydroxybutyryl-CoA epimerase
MYCHAVPMNNSFCFQTDGDIGAVFGLGFPPMKGGTVNIIFSRLIYIFNLGPFVFMDTYGISNIVDLMKTYQLKYGDRFSPTSSLIEMSISNKKFYS